MKPLPTVVIICTAAWATESPQEAKSKGEASQREGVPMFDNFQDKTCPRLFVARLGGKTTACHPQGRDLSVQFQAVYPTPGQECPERSPPPPPKWVG